MVLHAGGQKHGPLDAAGLKRLARAGQLQPADTIWREGLPDWVPAGRAKGLFTDLSSTPPVPNVTAAPESGVAGSPRCSRPVGRRGGILHGYSGEKKRSPLWAAGLLAVCIGHRFSGRLLGLSLVVGGLVSLSYVNALPWSLLSVLVFVPAFRRDGRISWWRFLPSFAILSIALQIYNAQRKEPGFVAGGALGFVVVFACGYIGSVLQGLFVARHPADKSATNTKRDSGDDHRQLPMRLLSLFQVFDNIGRGTPPSLSCYLW